MNGNRFAPPVQFSLEPSRRLNIALIAAHGLALSAAWLSAVMLPVKTVLGLVIPVHLFFVLKRQSNTHHLICYCSESGWDIDGESVSIMPSTVLTPFAVWLHYKDPNSGKKALLILHDAMSETDFRRLIVKLKISSA